VIKAGASYGWPKMGDFPFPDCAAAPGEQPIFHFSREGKNPGDFLSFVEVSGLSYLTGSTYSALTDGLIVCEGQKSSVDNVVTDGVLRRLTFSDPRTVASSDIIVHECKGDAAVHDGVVYYSTGSELKKLVQGGEAPADTGRQQQHQTPPPLAQPTS